MPSRRALTARTTSSMASITARGWVF
jgi:hypothetical protein